MRYLFFLVLTGLISSCTINKNVMFRTDQDYVFDTPSDTTDLEYVISPNDVMTFRLFTNDGAKLLEFTTGSSEQQPLHAGIDALLGEALKNRVMLGIQWQQRGPMTLHRIHEQ